jgi:hypothetical protein
LLSDCDGIAKRLPIDRKSIASDCQSIQSIAKALLSDCQSIASRLRKNRQAIANR